ncbi:MAG: endo-polygalacturonase [Bacteroidales bacterium]|jgi:polygalacturonase|nr:endo-polygalacturonase [Bacteroidales bacterium]
MKNKIWLLILIACISCSCANKDNHIKIYPAPEGEELSTAYEVKVEGEKIPVYQARIAPEDDRSRWLAMDDKANSALYHDTASFAYFDMNGPVKISVSVDSKIRSAKILPSSLGMVPDINGNTISFNLDQPRKLTIEINDDWIHCLHIFANPFETDIPEKDDPDVIYFGPGIHEISHLRVSDNKTVYIAGGAVVRAIIDPEEKYWISSYSGLRGYTPTLELRGKNIKVRGRGILDATGCTTHARNMINIKGENIEVEGIILRDPSTWTIPIFSAENVTVNNIKILGYRANSDGIDICSSHDITVNDCFIRTLDDLVVVKTLNHEGPAGRILVQDCVLWNEVAHALSIGAELTNNVDQVTFRNCDVIHDQGREWALRIFHSDAATISNIRFEDIRIEESRRFISLWLGEAVWSKDQERGNIHDVVFKNIHASGRSPDIELKGHDREHKISRVLFENVSFNGNPVSQDNMIIQGFVEDIEMK